MRWSCQKCSTCQGQWTRIGQHFSVMLLVIGCCVSSTWQAYVLSIGMFFMVLKHDATKSSEDQFNYFLTHITRVMHTWKIHFPFKITTYNVHTYIMSMPYVWERERERYKNHGYWEISHKPLTTHSQFLKNSLKKIKNQRIDWTFEQAIDKHVIT